VLKEELQGSGLGYSGLSSVRSGEDWMVFDGKMEYIFEQN